MFDIGFLELTIIGIVALIVVGPKDLPGMFRQAGRFMGKMRGMAREFQRSMEEAADESGLKEAASTLRGSKDLGLNSATRSAQSYAKKMLDETEPESEPSADGSAPGTSLQGTSSSGTAAEPGQSAKPAAGDQTRAAGHAKPAAPGAKPADKPTSAQPDEES